MAIEPNPRFAQLATALIESFTPIYQEWRPRQTGTSLPITAEECLYQDIFNLCNALAAMDNRAQFLETRLMAEILALFKKSQSAVTYDFVVDDVDKEIAAANRRNPLPAGEFSMPELVTARAVNEWVSSHETRKPKAKAVVDKLLSVVNLLVIADGNVTKQELGVFSTIGKQFEI